MKSAERYLILGKLLWVLLWLLILGGLVYDGIWNHFINPLGVLILFILIVGTIISRLRNQPIISTKGWLPRTIFAVILLVLPVSYIFVHIFLLK